MATEKAGVAEIDSDFDRESFFERLMRILQQGQTPDSAERVIRS